MKKVFLSKSSYCKCLQCPKIFWLKKYKPEEAIQNVNPVIFENGKKVGILAQDLFGKKHDDIKYDNNYKAMIEKTREYLDKKPNIITEASFSYENNFCMVDILKNDDDGVEIYEVKSSTGISDVYLDDASFQYYVLSGLGLNVKKVSIVYINKQYIRQENLDLDELFNIQDITNIALEKQEEIRKNVDMINRFMNEHKRENEPSISIGKQCYNPYNCDFQEYCNKRGNMIVNRNNKESTDIEDYEPVIDQEAIKRLLDSLKYPLYFIDYETYMSPIPEIVGTRPYQMLPFQYSLHIIKEEGAVPVHKEFLAERDDNNFVRHFAESMIENLNENGSVIVYNQSFEESRNNELAMMYTDLEDEIRRINNNMIDFMLPFKKKEYYTKEMHNSYSLKKVLPALYPDDPELDYTSLAVVHNGQEASDTFRSLKYKTPQEEEKIRRGLLEYCKLDTLALVKIYEKFLEVTAE